MLCKYPGCEESADYPYPCCSQNHGVKFKSELNLVKCKQNGETLTGWGQNLYSKLTPEQIEYYKKLI